MGGEATRDEERRTQTRAEPCGNGLARLDEEYKSVRHGMHAMSAERENCCCKRLLYPNEKHESLDVRITICVTDAFITGSDGGNNVRLIERRRDGCR